MHEIDLRLKKAADFVRAGSAVADIGTDHAYLPAYLSVNKIAKKVIACDLKSGPLKNAEETVNKLGLNSIIEVRKSDGLENISPNEVSDIVICGMGGNLIVDILKRASWLKNERYRLILQPQSHAYDLREFLHYNKFIIKNETSVKSDNRVYSIIVAEFQSDYSETRDEIDIYFGNLIYDKNEYSKEICRRTLEYLKVRRNTELEFGSREKSDYFKSIIDRAEEIMNDNQRNI